MTQAKNYSYIRSVDELARLMKKIEQEPERPFAFDLETGYEGPPRDEAGLAWHATAFIAGFSFTIDTRWSRYVPLRHDLIDENLDEDSVWEIMRPTLETKRVIAHNAPFEKHGLHTVGIEMGILSDTQVEAFILSDFEKVGLKALTKAAFGHQQRELIELFPTAKKGEGNKIRFNTLPLRPDVVAYACEDTVWGLAHHERQMPRLRADPKLWFIYGIEMEVLEDMVEVVSHGVGVDWEQMEQWLETSREFVRVLEDEVRADFGGLLGRSLAGLNVKSPTQLSKLMFDPAPEGLGLPILRMTKGGAKQQPRPSTDDTTLESIAKKDPEKVPAVAAVKKLLTARAVDMERKRYETWLDKKPGKYPIRGRDGRVHPNYNQTRVPTGRFAANGPAIQQLPHDAEFELSDGRRFEPKFRDLIVPTPGRYLLGFDYSQIELRAIAGLAKEQALMDAFERGDDIHTLTAAKMLNKPIEEVDRKKDRPKGKTINFAVIYQQGVRALAESLGIPIEEAQSLFDGYWSSFPSIAAYVEQSKDDAKRRIPPHTLSFFGRRATLWFLANSNVSHAQFATGERQAVNYPVQGWAADYMKIAMVRAARTLKKLGWWMNGVWLLMNQHDALEYEVSQDLDPREVMRVLIEAVEFPVQGFPKIASEWEFGYRYGSMKKCNVQGALDDHDNLVGSFEFVDGRWHLTGEAGQIERDEVFMPPVDPEDRDPRIPTLPEEPLIEAEHIPVVISVDRTPTRSEFTSLVTLATTTPGNYDVTLRMPSGQVSVATGSSLNVASSADVALVLPGAAVYHPDDRGIDIALIAEAMG